MDGNDSKGTIVQVAQTVGRLSELSFSAYVQSMVQKDCVCILWVTLGSGRITGFSDFDPDRDPAGSNPEPGWVTQTQKVH